MGQRCPTTKSYTVVRLPVMVFISEKACLSRDTLPMPCKKVPPSICKINQTVSLEPLTSAVLVVTKDFVCIKQMP